MRELKFRLIRDGKIVGYEKWYPGQGKPIDVTSAEPCWLYSRNGGETWNPTPIPHKTKDQFTGLTANGVEIYEGDIIKDADSGSYGAVVWSNDKHWGYLFDTRPDHGWNHPTKGFQRDHLEVIGNIHENPELLTTAPA